VIRLALEKDPRFAPAAAGLAMVWTARQQMGFAAPSEAGPKAKSEARRALELDDTCAMAHFALATLLTYTDWDFPAAGREWSRAVELDPGDALAALSKTTFVLPSDVAWFYIEAGDEASALDWLEKGYEVRDPSMVYLGIGWYDGLRAEPRFQALLRKMNLPQ
jgi:hypothetical protein